MTQIPEVLTCRPPSQPGIWPVKAQASADKMKQVYLATDSKARRQLFKLFGLKFKVIPSRVKEKRRTSGSSYAALVKRNALQKARAAAVRVKNGIIIAADTVSVQDGRIFGKPKDLREARRMLKRFSAKPQWVYTGVAVIDKERNKTLSGYEKTKVYMDKLKPAQINAYFAQVSPLDKAGSFDIQGKGALFIRRIEGCFYNVVGLPLRTLYRMLKKLDVKVFLILLMLFFALTLTGCSTEYNIVTGQQETYYYSSEREEQMGKSISKAVEKEYKLAQDPLLRKRMEDIGKKIVAVSDRQDIDYHFEVLDDEEVNAVSLPGGYVYVNKGLIDVVDNDDQLAAVLAHEIAHIVARHSIKKLQALQGYSLLRVLFAATPETQAVGAASDVAFGSILMGYSREDELLADQLGARYLELAGYNPRAMINFLEKLERINKRKPLRPRSYFRSHPFVPDRIRVVKEEIGEEISFKDYINIEQPPHR
ncbi:MAG: Maf family nucleotide pyrophosphatase [Candidatus Omnitrophota bacterium]